MCLGKLRVAIVIPYREHLNIIKCKDLKNVIIINTKYDYIKNCEYYQKCGLDFRASCDTDLE